MLSFVEEVDPTSRTFTQSKHKSSASVRNETQNTFMPTIQKFGITWKFPRFPGFLLLLFGLEAVCDVL